MADVTALIEQQIPALRRYAYALLRDRDRADDLVQDTLERALTHRASRRDDGDLRAWLFAIQRNLYISAHRRRARWGTPMALDEAELPSVAARQEGALEMRDVLSALDQLPEEQRSLLLLVGVEDFSYEEAARILGMPMGTVMSRLSRGRQRLRTLLETGKTALLRRVK